MTRSEWKKYLERHDRKRLGKMLGSALKSSTVFQVGDIVRHKAAFLKSIGWLTDVPKDGKIIELRKMSNEEWPVVEWCDGGEPQMIHPQNIMLAEKPDYSGM